MKIAAMQQEEAMPIGSNFKIEVAFTPGAYKGCYKDDKDKEEERDLTLFVGQDISREECELTCKNQGFKHFARQWLQECWCANSYGRQGPARGCLCEVNV